MLLWHFLIHILCTREKVILLIYIEVNSQNTKSKKNFNPEVKALKKVRTYFFTHLICLTTHSKTYANFKTTSMNKIG